VRKTNSINKKDKKAQIVKKKVSVCIILAAMMFFSGIAGCIADKGNPVETSKGHSNQSNSAENSDISIQTLLSCKSERTNKSCAIYVDNHFSALVATPIAMYYDENGTQHKMPLVFEGKHKPYMEDFLSRYEKYSIDSPATAATTFWNKSDARMVVEDNFDGYSLGVSAAVIASYLNIPIVIGTSQFDKVKDSLGVKYVIEVGNVLAGFPSIQLKKQDELQNLTIEILKRKFGEVGYITITNPNDINCSWSVEEISCLAPYITTYHKGIVVIINIEPLTPFETGLYAEGVDEQIYRQASATNEKASFIKTKLMDVVEKLNKTEMLQPYLEKSPYFAIIGDAFTIPFHYFPCPYNVNWLIPTDDYYCDIFGNESEYLIELASGRTIASSVMSTCDLILRHTFYSDYLNTIGLTGIQDSAANLTGAAWKNKSFVVLGDDWNGAVFYMAPNYIEAISCFRDNDFDTHTVAIISNSIVTEGLLAECSSSNYLYFLMHGAPDGLGSFQLGIGDYSPSEVRKWNMGPSTIILVACSAARIDWYDQKNTLSMAFSDSGTNAYIGGMRDESASQSATISQYVLDALVKENLSCGLAVKNAKNRWVEDGYQNAFYYSGMKILYGDPAFNPYEPCNEGAA